MQFLWKWVQLIVLHFKTVLSVCNQRVIEHENMYQRSMGFVTNQVAYE